MVKVTFPPDSHTLKEEVISTFSARLFLNWVGISPQVMVEGKGTLSSANSNLPNTEKSGNVQHLPYDHLLVGVIEGHEKLSVFPNSAHKVSHKDIEAVGRG